MIANSLPGMWGTVFIGVANHLWQSTVFTFAIALLTFAFRNNHARTRYWLWFAASMKFLLPFYLLIVLGSHFPWLHRTPQKSDASEITASNLVVERMSQPFTLSAAATPVSESTGRPSIAVRMTALLGPIPPLPAILVTAWLCGFLSVMGRWSCRCWKMAAAIRNALPVLDGREVEALRRIEHLGALRVSVEVLSLPASMEPGVFGLHRPVLLWPQAITTRLDDAHLEAVLAHEISHVRRRDNLTAAMHMFVEAIFWFHPLVWWLETRLVEERENACDEEVLQLLHQPGIYAESILKVCEFCVDSPLACVSGITGADLKKRIAQIMTGTAARKLGFGGKVLLLSAASLTTTAPIMLGSWHRPVALAQTGQPTGQAQTAPATEQSMEADASPGFLVATIKPSDPNSTSGWGFPNEGHHITCVNATVATIMTVAYGIHVKQIAGAPEWLSKDRYDINGIPDVPGVPNLVQKRKMYQKLLADRFHLVFHRETREMPIYAITVAKAGPILTPADPKETRINTGNSGGGGQRTLKFTNMSMSDFALNMNLYEDRPVIDQTSLPGRYNFTLKWTYDVSREDEAGSPPSLFTAIKEQLGLRMAAVKGPAEVFVIDHVERPSVN